MITTALPKMVLNSKMFKHMQDMIVNEFGIPMTSTNHKGYAKKWSGSHDFITWGMKWKNSSYKAQGKNILFIENGLYKQSSGVYCDDMGYFGESSIVKDKSYFQKPTVAEMAFLKEHTRKHFAVDYDHKIKYDPNGPIIICLQLNRDASMQFNFPLCKVKNRNDFFVSQCIKYLPKDKEVIVRKHPRDKKGGTSLKLPVNWKRENSGGFMGRARKASAVIVVNSTVGTESLCLGMPVATMGQSIFHKSGVTLDCSEDPSNLKDIMGFKPKWKLIDSYLCSIIRSQLMFTDNKVSLLKHKPFIRWLDRCKVNQKTKKKGNIKIYADSHPNKPKKPKELVEEPKQLCDTAIIQFNGCGGWELAKSLSKSNCGKLGIFNVESIDIDNVIDDKRVKKIYIQRQNLFHAYVDHKMGRHTTSKRCNVNPDKLKRWMIDSRELTIQYSPKCDVMVTYEDIVDETINDILVKIGKKKLSLVKQNVHYEDRQYDMLVPKYHAIVRDVEESIGLFLKDTMVENNIIRCRRCQKDMVDKASKSGICKHCGVKNI